MPIDLMPGHLNDVADGRDVLSPRALEWLLGQSNLGDDCGHVGDTLNNLRMALFWLLGDPVGLVTTPSLEGTAYRRLVAAVGVRIMDILRPVVRDR